MSAEGTGIEGDQGGSLKEQGTEPRPRFTPEQWIEVLADAPFAALLAAVSHRCLYVGIAGLIVEEGQAHAVMHHAGDLASVRGALRTLDQAAGIKLMQGLFGKGQGPLIAGPDGRALHG